MIIDGNDYSSVLTLKECYDGLAKSFEVQFNNFHPGSVVFFEATLHGKTTDFRGELTIKLYLFR